MIDLNALEAAEKAATAGPWCITVQDTFPTMWLNEARDDFTVADLNFIDLARNSLPSLLARLRAVESVVAAAKVWNVETSEEDLCPCATCDSIRDLRSALADLE